MKNKKNFGGALLCAGLCVLVILIATTNIRAQEDPKEAARRSALMGEAAQILMARQWTLYLTLKPALSKKHAVVETDTFTFTERTVTSSRLSSQGYARGGSNYSLYVQDNTTVVWETMQVHENETDRAFLKGEVDLNSGAMQGVIVYKSGKDKGATYYYTSLAQR